MSPAKQLAGFLAKFTPEVAADARAALATMRKRLPGAVQLVYDNYNALVIGFGPTERASEAPFSLVVFPRWVTLCFLQGAKLPDPQRRLKGGGKQVRHIRLDQPGVLEDPVVVALMARAVEQSPKPFTGKGRGPMLIRAIMAKQRPRRPA